MGYALKDHISVDSKVRVIKCSLSHAIYLVLVPYVLQISVLTKERHGDVAVRASAVPACANTKQ